jgi:hypothetical protein
MISILLAHYRSRHRLKTQNKTSPPSVITSFLTAVTVVGYNIIMEEIMKAYLAGCLDSDGYFTIKRSTYHMRVRGDAGNPVFSEKVGLKQVKCDIVDLLWQHFGGYRRIEKPSAKNGQPLFAWQVTDRQAISCVQTLLPYLRIKKEQAAILLQLRESKERTKGHSHNRIPPAEIQIREKCFNAAKARNDVRATQPVLI